MDIETREFYKGVILTSKPLRTIQLRPLESVKGKMNYKCLFSTKYGDIYKIPSDLKRGRGVSLKSAVDKTRYFVNMCKEIHGDKYDYKYTEYRGHRKKVKIVCKVHGAFMQDPFNIITNKCGCSKCAKGTIDKQEFIRRANDKYDYKYDYTNIEYNRMIDKVNIKCPVHGYFMQTPSIHLQLEYGCKECYFEHKSPYYNTKNAYINKEEWIKIKAILYFVKLKSKEEEFYKVGVTNRTINKRFGKPFEKLTGYSVGVIKKYNTNLYEAVIMEGEIIRNNREHKYLPKVSFGGLTECFNRNIFKNE